MEKCSSVEKLEEYAQKLKVCGHPLRLQILLLIERKDACVSDLWKCLNLPQPVISQHLAVLKDREIVQSETDGNKRIYKIIDPFVQKIIQSFEIDQVV